MADDTRENELGSSVAPGSVAPPKKLPKGFVLGKDGKPCRTCTDLSNFSQAGKSLKGTTKGREAPAGLPADCPPDVVQLGNSSWTLLHSIAASYPESPTSTEKTQVKQFMGLFAKLYPCWVCAEDFQEFMTRSKVRAESREDFGQWMCEAHNEVNRKLGKKEFDCSKWQERWRTGWKNGVCD